MSWLLIPVLLIGALAVVLIIATAVTAPRRTL